MKYETNMKRRFLGYFFALTLVFTMLIGLGVTASAADKTVLAFTSDVHNGGSRGDDNNVSGQRLRDWLDSIKAKYGENGVDVMGFCGDMGPASNSNTFWSYVEYATDVVTNHSAIKASNGGRAVITTGNHEYSPGNFGSATSDAKKLYKIGEEGRSASTYRIYCLGTLSGSSYSWGYTSDQATALTNYLNSVDNSKPIFVLTHFPLHIYSEGGRTTSNASIIIDALNKAVEKNNQKIILLWGHNHTVADPHYDTVFLPGAGLKYSSSSDIKGIKFYYAAAGSMADSEYMQSGQVKGKGLIVTIDENQDLDFTYYNKSGAAVEPVIEKKGDGTPTDTPSSDDPGTDDPSTDGTVDITPTSDSPTPSRDAAIKVGQTLTINVTNGTSQNQTYKFSAELSNSGVAKFVGSDEVTIAPGEVGQFTVEGVANGTVDINIKNTNQYGSQYVRKGVIHLTVGEGGSTPVDPSDPTDSVDINPVYNTPYPEESATINVNDTLTINVKNGSGNNNSYTYTASLGSNNGVAELTKSSTGELSAGATGTLTVKGLKAGTVDINIQNDNTMDGYTRKGTVHLTVVEATPVMYKVKFVNDDGTPISEKEYEKGTKAEAIEVPTATKEATPQYTYEFKAWDPAVADVTSNATYRATYEEKTRTYKVTWKNADGTVLEEDPNVAYGTKVKYAGKTPEKAEDDKNTYTFAGWDPEVPEDGFEVVEDKIFTAKFKAEEKKSEGNTGDKKSDGQGGQEETPITKEAPSAEEFAKAPVDNSLPVINPEKIKTTGSMSKKTMTIKLGTLDADNCLVEYKEASAKTWKSVWYGKGSQLVIKGMKKNGLFQYRFTTVKLVNGQWRKGKPSNICYRWIMNVKAKKPVAGKKKITVKWSKVKKCNGYEIQYATNKAFTKNLKKVTVKGAKKTSKTIKGLKKGKTYYVRIRPYKTKGGKKYLGILTTAKKVKVK